jgi:hypothetical protein
MTRAATLRVSLLVAMGIVPIACGGTTRNQNRDEGNAGTDGNGRAGDKAVGAGGNGTDGGTNVGGHTTSTGGVGIAGSPSKAGSSAGGAAGAGGTSFNCKNPTLNPATGLVECEGGYFHRPEAKACDNAGGQPGVGGEGPVDPHTLPRADDFIDCSGPEDCAGFQWGFCGGGGGEIPHCVSGCETDNDCGSGSICICGNPSSPTGGECRPAACATDADCPGSVCAAHHSSSGCGAITFRCITERDACASDADCGALNQQCLWNPDKEARECGAGAVCGRPFLVAEQPRLPPVAERADWCDTARPRVDHLTPSERAELAQHWTKLGQMEHASIAAFARFSLQLLALGAPPDLVEACTRALADETAHAKLCFGIASAYAARAIGPGPLDVANSLDVTSLADIVDLVILEGCIGETTAALEALESAETATDPVIRHAYARIAADEQRHAELAFRFVQWAVESGGPDIEAHVAAALALLPTTTTCEQVVKPCLSALCRATERAA